MKMSAPPPDAGRQKVLVLGAGVAGLSAAKTLAAQGHHVTVLDARDHCGGAHRSHEIGPYTFDVGSIFYEDTARIFDLAEGLRDMCPPARRIQRRISPEGTLLHYPLEPRDFLRWPRLRLIQGLADMLWSRMRGRQDGTLETVCRTRFGATFLQGTGLESYITRFNHVPPSQVDESFFFYRMGFLEKATRFDALVRSAWRAVAGQPFRKGPPASLRVRPPEGFHHLFDAIKDALTAEGVEFALGETLDSIQKTENGTRVTTDKQIHDCDVLVAAIPVDAVHKALIQTSSGLMSLNLLTLFISAENLAEKAGNVLFNFHKDGLWKRITVYSRLYPDRNTTPREYFAAEVTLPPGATPDPEAAFADLSAHVTGLGLARDLRLEGYDVVDSAYPLYAPGTEAVLNDVIQRISKTGVILIGRQGRFEYLPTSTGVIRRVGEQLALEGLMGPVPSADTTTSG